MVKEIVRRSQRPDDGELFPDDRAPIKGWIVAHCDGGSRGNPGPSGFGVLIEDKAAKVIAELSEFVGKRTNNYAEYAALLAALNFALEQGHPRLRVISDSELMVKQIKGQYRVNSPELKPLHEEARHRIARLESFEIQHVLREKNRKADQLANLAMDRGMGRIVDPPVGPSVKPLVQPSGGPAAPLPGKVAAKTAGLGTAAAPVARPIPIVRADSKSAAPPAAPQPVRGFVKGGVVHLLDGARLPDGTFVNVIPEN